MFKLNVDDTWVKGSLHCHSTASDGILKPKEVVDYYLSRGYGLIAITDHGKITTEHINNQRGILLSSIEISKGTSKLRDNYHIVAIGVDDPALNDLKSPSEVIDEINASGGVAIIAHPYWSELVYEDLINLSGYIGIEVYNTGCDVEVTKGYSTVHWDDLISSGVKSWGFAVDDAHRYFVPPIDADGGWIWVKVTDKSPEAVIESLKAGHFYSSMGPKINRLEMSESLIHVELTPVTRVNIVSRNGRGLSIEKRYLLRLIKMWKSPGRRCHLERMFDSIEVNEKNGLTRAFITGKKLKAETAFDRKGLKLLHIEAKFDGDYVRIEAIDKNGRTAWSNPLLLGKIHAQ